MYSNKKARLENESELMQAGIGIYDVHELQSISKTLHALDEHSCNGYYSERAEKSAETREANLEKRADEIARTYGKKAYHQSDPRGWSLYLISPDQNDSNYSSGLSVCPF
jgi:hypothetical protein